MEANEVRKILIVNVGGTVLPEVDDYLLFLEQNGTGNSNIKVTHADNASELSEVFNQNSQTDIILSATHGYEYEASIGSSNGDIKISATQLSVTNLDSNNRLFLDMCYQGKDSNSQKWAEATGIPNDDIVGNKDVGRGGTSALFLFEVLSGSNIDDAWDDYRNETDYINTTGEFSQDFDEKWNYLLEQFGL